VSNANVPTVGDTFGNPSYSAVVHATYAISPTLLKRDPFNYNGKPHQHRFRSPARLEQPGNPGRISKATGYSRVRTMTTASPTST